MKRFFWTLSVVAITSTLIMSAVHSKVGRKIHNEMKAKVDIELDQESAVKIAEVILVKVYGKKVLDQKPWKIEKSDSLFSIEGTALKTEKGGVALIQISRKTAEVLALSHGK